MSFKDSVLAVVPKWLMHGDYFEESNGFTI